MLFFCLVALLIERFHLRQRREAVKTVFEKLRTPITCDHCYEYSNMKLGAYLSKQANSKPH